MENSHILPIYAAQKAFNPSVHMVNLSVALATQSAVYEMTEKLKITTWQWAKEMHRWL